MRNGTFEARRWRSSSGFGDSRGEGVDRLSSASLAAAFLGQRRRRFIARRGGRVTHFAVWRALLCSFRCCLPQRDHGVLDMPSIVVEAYDVGTRDVEAYDCRVRNVVCS